MMFARISEDPVAFSLKVSAPRILVVLGVLRGAGTSIQGWEEEHGFEAYHGSAAWRMGKKRLGIQVKTTVTCVDNG